MKLCGYSNHNSEVVVIIVTISGLLILEYLAVWVWQAVISKAFHKNHWNNKDSVEDKK